MTTEWNSYIPKSLLVFATGVLLLGIGIVWLLHKLNKENKKDITEMETKHDYSYRMETNIEI